GGRAAGCRPGQRPDSERRSDLPWLAVIPTPEAALPGGSPAERSLAPRDDGERGAGAV
ncbi:MAG: hypothetical protein AVDCRST_MAG19-1330, partial [uncultured Thermomicrobiales bacterium]